MNEQEVPPLPAKPRRPRQTRKQKVVQTPTINHPAPDDREGWKTHWKSQGQPWRTEPEISSARQSELKQNRSIVPDIEKGIYPFKGKTLTRADVEWLLATHENGRGPAVLQDDCLYPK